MSFHHFWNFLNEYIYHCIVSIPLYNTDLVLQNAILVIYLITFQLLDMLKSFLNEVKLIFCRLNKKFQILFFSVSFFNKSTTRFPVWLGVIMCCPSDYERMYLVVYTKCILPDTHFQIGRYTLS